VSSHFAKSPFFLNGQNHLKSKKELIDFYKIIDLELHEFIGEYTNDYFSKAKKNLSLLTFVSDYISEIFKQMLAKNLNCDMAEVPSLPGEIFFFYPQKKSLLDYDERINRLNLFVIKHLLRAQRDTNDSWMLLSIAIMGTETLFSAIVYGLLNDHYENIPTLINEASPVTLIGRIIKEDTVINSLRLFKGQSIYLATALTYNTKVDKQEPSIAFGYGVHICPGKKISIIILESFFKAWKDFNQPLNTEHIEFKKDFMNRPVEII
jgi:hypothetical protein